MSTDNVNANYQMPKGLMRDVPTSSLDSKPLTQKDFLKILTAQMIKQDPMKPFDSGEMMQQMSQLTSLSATQELKSAIDGLKQNQFQSQFFSSSQLIGKNIALLSTISPLTDEGFKGSLVLSGRASDVSVEIKDKGGKVVKTISLPGSEAGVVDFAWDGLNEKGEAMPKDFYTMNVKASNGGVPVEALTMGVYKVKSVTLDRKSYSTIVNVDGLGGVSMDNVIKILS